jgi:hypothetical protein
VRKGINKAKEMGHPLQAEGQIKGPKGFAEISCVHLVYFVRIV